MPEPWLEGVYIKLIQHGCRRKNWRVGLGVGMHVSASTQLAGANRGSIHFTAVLMVTNQLLHVFSEEHAKECQSRTLSHSVLFVLHRTVAMGCSVGKPYNTVKICHCQRPDRDICCAALISRLTLPKKLGEIYSGLRLALGKLKVCATLLALIDKWCSSRRRRVPQCS